MGREFAAKLVERVVSTFLIGFAATYLNVLLGADGGSTPVVGQLGQLLRGLESLSLLHKAVVAGILAIVQMAVSVLVAPHVGDPNSPDLVPKRFLKQGLHDVTSSGRYAASEELQHVLRQAAAANPTAPLTTDAVVAAAAQARETPATSAT